MCEKKDWNDFFERFFKKDLQVCLFQERLDLGEGAGAVLLQLNYCF